MADIKYLEVLIECIKEIYNNESEYFSNFRGGEQAVQFRIAHKMANLIENSKNDIFVDCEVRRCNGVIKVENRRPDIVVHKRNGVGFLVIELKCGVSERNWENDFYKLKLFTMRNKHPMFSDIPTYKIGVFVCLGGNLNDVIIKVFENGMDVSCEKYYIDVLKGLKNV